MEMKLKLAFHIGTRDQKTVELDKEEAKELYDLLHEMFGEKEMKWNDISTYPVCRQQNPWWNYPTYMTITDNVEWHSKDSGITASFTEKL